MIKKHDRVEFTRAGKLELGVVLSVTKAGRASVMLDGAKASVSGPAAAFRISSIPLPKDPAHLMDRWAVIKYKEFKELSEETTAYAAEITLDGKAVVFASNEGHGGSDFFRGLKSGDQAHAQQFEADAKAWELHFGPKDEGVFESGATFVEWFVHSRPYGVTASAYLAEMAAMFSDTAAA